MKTVKSITIVTDQLKKETLFFDDSTPKITLNYLNFISDQSKSFCIEIEFNLPIQSFRNHDYNWVDVSHDRIAPEFTSKIIKLQDGTVIQPNLNVGIWEVNPKNKQLLLWRFNPEYANPLTEYSGAKNVKKIVSAKNNINLDCNLELLFSNQNALEISRSAIPFSAIACFTDHCDYDTLENLTVQRTLFSDLKIKTTKGFFLNHFSKRTDNASIENNKQEIEKWLNDGHELAYHSLSQSIKSTEESFEDFRAFQPPFDTIPVWIDHGFQPYNFSLYKNNSIKNDDFESVLNQKNIKVLWNYIDCGTATNGVINQLNTTQFTLAKYWNSIEKFSFKSKIVKLIKAIIFHFDNDENRIRNYIDSISAVRNLVKKKNPLEIINFLKNSFPVLVMVLKVFLRWKAIKNKPFKAAKFAPIVFEHQIENTTFAVFQTIELVDFISGLSKKNTDLLIEENGLFIAHTYFSVDMKHHQGKLFKDKNTLDENVVANFEYLSNRIKENKIWNPTVSDLIEHLQNFKKTVFDIDKNGVIFIKNNSNIPSRTIQ